MSLSALRYLDGHMRQQLRKKRHSVHLDKRKFIFFLNMVPIRAEMLQKSVVIKGDWFLKSITYSTSVFTLHYVAAQKQKEWKILC